MKLSIDGAAFIARHEGKLSYPYHDALGCSVGIGHLLHMGPCTEQELSTFYSDDEILALFEGDVAVYEAAVNRYVTVPLSQEQFDALTSFAFNWGIGAGTGFPATSVVALVNQGRFEDAATDLVDGHGPSGRPYDKGLAGVRKRRQEEAAMLRQALPVEDDWAWMLPLVAA